MTETFSIGQAIATPFHVIRRHPLSVFVWGFLISALGLFAAIFILGTLAGMPLAETGSEPSPEVLGPLVAVQGFAMLVNFVQLALGLVIWAATMRATLRIGRPDRFFFLRAGMDEVRLLVVGIALFVGTYVAVLVVVLLGAALSAVVWQASEAAAVILGFLLVLGLIVAVAVAMARLSLIAPATMILGRLAFVEGWVLGRRRTLRLLGLLICTWLAYMAIYFVVAFVVIVALIASGTFAHFQALSNAATLGELFPSPGVMWVVAALVLAPGAFLYGSVMTLLSAPFVSACRQLMDGAPQGDAAPAMV